MLKITFAYRDEMTKGEWRVQQCFVDSVEECKRIYGLDGSDPTLIEYEITNIEELKYDDEY